MMSTLELTPVFDTAEPDYLAVSASSQQFALTLDSGVVYQFTADVACYLRVAANPTASAADGSLYVPAGRPQLLATATTGHKLACIGATGVATLARLTVKL